ncbi:MAG: hypothetical protein AUG51_13410 [Acidobacteria bacterium 13_1_20CM_3_53_8]|nr:MAG: hypothetical protein AUG51_13410 [Acidobacteria bacterium 13_1_20CM_3_53_8]
MPHTFYDLIGQFGLYAVFFLTVFEGDITLLLAGVLAHSEFFGNYSFVKILCAGTLGGVVSDNVAYLMGREFGKGACKFHFYRAAQPRIERLTRKFGPYSIFLSKFIYGLRWGSCAFYGVGRMPYLRFLLLTFASCFVWVLFLSGAGYFFSGAITNLIGDYHRIGFYLLVLVTLSIIAFYMAERFWLTKKIEEADPERFQELEQEAKEKLIEFKEEIQERMHLSQMPRRKEKPKHKRGEAEGD